MGRERKEVEKHGGTYHSRCSDSFAMYSSIITFIVYISNFQGPSAVLLLYPGKHTFVIFRSSISNMYDLAHFSKYNWYPPVMGYGNKHMVTIQTSCGPYKSMLIL